MVFNFKNKSHNLKGQAILEYTVFIVMAALVFLTILMRSNLGGVIKGRWRKDISSIGTDQYSSASTTSYTLTNTSSLAITQGAGSGPYSAYFDNF